MSQPPYPYTPKPFETQNLNDDDPIVMDELVKTTSAPADIHGAIEPVVKPTDYRPKAATRALTSTVRIPTVANGGQVQRITSEDLNRATCKLRGYSKATTPSFDDYVIVADDPGKIASGSVQAANILRHNQTLDWDGHTGPIFITPGPATTDIFEVTAWGITTLDGTEQNT